MGCDLNGASADGGRDERINVFALVIYIPDPLGKFLDDLRRELVPAYNPHAHVSVLPPRPIAVEQREAAEQARAVIESWTPFDVELTNIAIFPVTDVTYLEVGGGAAELRRMHTAMNSGALAFEEPFEYHPHITLAQEVPHDRVAMLTDLAVQRWRHYAGPRVFRAERATFVQSTLRGCWIDLAECALGTMARVPR